MKNAQVPPETAFAICGLFSDPNDVYAKAQTYYEKDLWKEEKTENIKNISTDEGEESVAQNKNNEDAR